MTSKLQPGKLFTIKLLSQNLMLQHDIKQQLFKRDRNKYQQIEDRGSGKRSKQHAPPFAAHMTPRMSTWGQILGKVFLHFKLVRSSQRPRQNITPQDLSRSELARGGARQATPLIISKCNHAKSIKTSHFSAQMTGCQNLQLPEQGD